MQYHSILNLLTTRRLSPCSKGSLHEYSELYNLQCSVASGNVDTGDRLQVAPTEDFRSPYRTRVFSHFSHDPNCFCFCGLNTDLLMTTSYDHFETTPDSYHFIYCHFIQKLRS